MAIIIFSSLRFVIDQDSNNIAVIETDHNAYTDATKEQRKQQMAEEMVEAAGEEEQELAAEMAAAFLNEKLPEDVFGAPKAGWGMWASQIRLQVGIGCDSFLLADYLSLLRHSLSRSNLFIAFNRFLTYKIHYINSLPLFSQIL